MRGRKADRMLVLLMILWLLLWGRITWEILGIGLLISLAVWLFAVRALKYPWRRELRAVKCVPLALLYGLNLLWETLKAATLVAVLAMKPGANPEPVLVEFHSGLRRDALNVILANSITLTPGTITVFQDHDRFVIHALRREYAEGIEESSYIRLLRRFPQ